MKRLDGSIKKMQRMAPHDDRFCFSLCWQRVLCMQQWQILQDWIYEYQLSLCHINSSCIKFYPPHNKNDNETKSIRSFFLLWLNRWAVSSNKSNDISLCIEINSNNRHTEEFKNLHTKNSHESTPTTNLLSPIADYISWTLPWGSYTQSNQPWYQLSDLACKKQFYILY